MREKRLESLTAQLEIGITPACAGKTCVSAQEKDVWRDHPRVCGKNLVFMKDALMQPGSPPRVREKQIYQDIMVDLIGITPACAGKTEADIAEGLTDEDHPRVCGKNIMNI